MSRTMLDTVVLPDPVSGSPVVLLKGEECPEWALTVITNPEVLSPAEEGEAESAPRGRRSR